MKDSQRFRQEKLQISKKLSTILNDNEIEIFNDRLSNYARLIAIETSMDITKADIVTLSSIKKPRGHNIEIVKNGLFLRLDMLRKQLENLNLELF